MEEIKNQCKLCEQNIAKFLQAMVFESNNQCKLCEQNLAKSQAGYKEFDELKLHEICDMSFEVKKKLMENALGVLKEISSDDRWSSIVSAYMTAQVRRMGKAGTAVPAYMIEVMELENEGLRSKWEQDRKTWEQERKSFHQAVEIGNKKLAKLKLQHEQDRRELIQNMSKYKKGVYAASHPDRTKFAEIREAKSEASGSPLKQELEKLSEEPKENHKVTSNSKAEHTSHDYERLEQVYNELQVKYDKLDAKYNDMEKLVTTMPWEKMMEEPKASRNAEKEELAKELAKLKLEYEKDHKELAEKMLKESDKHKISEISANYLREHYALGLKHKEIQDAKSREIYEDYLREHYAREKMVLPVLLCTGLAYLILLGCLR